MEEMAKDFPNELFKAYSENRITRNDFVQRFSEWQKRHGINYGCKGTADKNGVRITYRGVTATIKGGLLVWCNGVKPVGRCKKAFDWRSAESIFEFKRMVDFALRDEWLWKGGGKCRELTR